jgi:cell division protein FtsI (penicillin-binding protein 3)/stage V sporulation protein D (sporulation-specific penicillin-binding protein)
VKKVESRPGSDLTTTLDPAVQLICESELRRALAKNRSEWACIVVMEPNSGEIRGVATWPSFDPNKYVRGEIGSELNVLHQRVVEPGSTVKPLLIAAALDRGWVPANKHYRCNQLLTINGYTIREAELSHTIGGDGGAPLKDILVHSSNIGMARLALDLGQRRVFDAYSDFGFFDRTGIELPVEAKGLRPHSYAGLSASWPRITLANSGFGQGMAVTPLQLATAYCVLANGGYWVRPTLVLGLSQAEQEQEQEAAPAQAAPRQLVLPAGETLLAGLGVGAALAADQRWVAPRTGAAAASGGIKDSRPAARPPVRVLSTETCIKVNDWLAEVVRSGTGKQAGLDRYAAAGKTGTAQIPSSKGGYRKGAYTASFVGFFPVERPRYVVAVIFGEPKGQYYGGAVAAPVFKSVSDRISYLQSSEFAGVVNASR